MPPQNTPGGGEPLRVRRLALKEASLALLLDVPLLRELADDEALRPRRGRGATCAATSCVAEVGPVARSIALVLISSSAIALLLDLRLRLHVGFRNHLLIQICLRRHGGLLSGPVLLLDLCLVLVHGLHRPNRALHVVVDLTVVQFDRGLRRHRANFVQRGVVRELEPQRPA